MFSGIVEGIGTILTINVNDGCKQFVIKPLFSISDFNIGDSIAVNGICLTVTEFTHKSFKVTAVPETLRLTNLNHLKENATVNLERAMTLNSRIGGHQVQGHVDAACQILDIQKDASEALLVKIAIDEKLAKFIVNKGYITIDGMSITVITATAEWFTVTFIPHTQAVTIVKDYQVGQIVNIEVDIIGKYLEKWLQPLLSTHLFGERT